MEGGREGRLFVRGEHANFAVRVDNKDAVGVDTHLREAARDGRKENGRGGREW